MKQEKAIKIVKQILKERGKEKALDDLIQIENHIALERETYSDYSVEDMLEGKMVFPEVKMSKDRSERLFVVVPGLLSPNGKTGPNNPVFKMPAYFENGYKYYYKDVAGRKVEINVLIK